MQKQAERANLSTAGPRALGPYLPVLLCTTRHQDIQALSEEARTPVGVTQHGHMVIKDSAPSPCSRPLSSETPTGPHTGLSGALVHTRNCNDRKRREGTDCRDSLHDHGCSTNYRRPEVLDA